MKQIHSYSLIKTVIIIKNIKGRKNIMQPVIIKNVTIGNGIPKICVSLLGSNRHEICTEIATILHTPIDVVEWRLDYFKEVEDIHKCLEMLEIIHNKLPNMPLITTFRSLEEGGCKAIPSAYYLALNKSLIRSGKTDVVDLELFHEKNELQDCINEAHSNNCKVILSNHDFKQTPNENILLNRFMQMQELGADIFKIALMPISKQDVITLLCVTHKMQQTSNCPIITMSMGELGVISRICGEVFGSALTFGALNETSAPGQLQVEELKKMLSIVHECNNIV
ncbi:MAG: type I 3-dehydroquinate dehydratase [Longicatena sp.]